MSGFLSLARLSQVRPVDTRCQILAAHAPPTFSVDVDAERFAKLLACTDRLAQIPNRRPTAEREVALRWRFHRIEEVQ